MTYSVPGSSRFSPAPSCARALSLPLALALTLALTGCTHSGNPCDALAGRWVGERTETAGVSTLPDPMVESLVRAMRWEFRAGTLVAGTERTPGQPEGTHVLGQEGGRCRLEVGSAGTRTHRILVGALQPDGRLRLETEGRGVALFLRRP